MYRQIKDTLNHLDPFLCETAVTSLIHIPFSSYTMFTWSSLSGVLMQGSLSTNTHWWLTWALFKDLQFSFYFPTMFLLIIWEFHTGHPDHMYFPVLLSPNSTIVSSLTLKKKEQKKGNYNLCCPYTHWNMVKFPMVITFNKTLPLPEIISFEVQHFRSFLA